MKASSYVLLVFVTVLFIYVVAVFRLFTPRSSSFSAPVEPPIALSPPLDVSLVTELEGRISAEHATVLKQREELATLHDKLDKGEEQSASLQSQVHSLSSQLQEANVNSHDKGKDEIVLLLQNREEEISDLKVKLSELKNDLKPKEAESAKQLSDSVVSVTSASRPSSQSYRPGVIVLGMHRSGTSVIGGLMNKMGLETGGPLIGAAKDNAKGFFERIDVVLQNDNLFKTQNVHYSYNTHNYDAKRGLRDILENEDNKFFAEGRRALKFLNNEKNYPWMLKDPRLCITLRTWLPMLNFVPAILFAYRNPYDVALSMHTRETEHFPIQRGLKLWYIYNKRAIKQSNDLCRVVTSHKRVLKDPSNEMSKIFNGLRDCGVNVPHVVSEADITSFVDAKLQHGKTKTLDTLCGQENVDFDSLMPPDTWPTTDATNVHLYRACIKAFCDLESGAAFKPEYSWDESIINK